MLQELDLHYLVITFVLSAIFIGALGAVREPMAELAFIAVFSPLANVVILALSFLGIAPWGFTKAQFVRCMIWIPTNFVAGSILTFLLLSIRVLYSAIVGSRCSCWT
jgi:hypothetical protein